MEITTVLIADDLIKYLEKRSLEKQYQKAKSFICMGYYDLVQLKKREPKNKNIYYFRINRQYRALCLLEDSVLKVFDIDNHQD